MGTDSITWIVVYKWAIRWMSIVLFGGTIGSVGAFWTTREFRSAAFIGWATLAAMGILLLTATGSYYLSKRQISVTEQRYL